MPRTPLETLTGAVSDIDEAKPEQVSVSKKSSQHEIIEEFRADHEAIERLAGRGECAILNQIRNDHELIERLKISPQELEALSKCALFGTLACKQDMLFILRQIREAGGPAVADTILFPQPAPLEDEEEDPVPTECRRIAARIARTAVAEPGSLEGIVRRRVPEQFGVLFWALVLVVGLACNFLIAMSRWRDNFITAIGMPAGQVPSSAAWYGNLDRLNLNAMLLWELLFVAGVVVVIYLKSRTGPRRFKVRPSRRLP